MRKELKKINGERLKFTATFEKFGYKSFGPHTSTTLLLKNVILDGKIMTDHFWINETKGLLEIYPLEPGDILEFEARVASYVKGYRGYRDDVFDAPLETNYKLSHPTRFRKIKIEC